MADDKAPVIDQSRFVIKIPGQANYEPVKLVTWTLTINSSVNTINGANAAIGSSKTRSGVTITLSYQRSQIAEAVDFFELEVDDVVFDISIFEGESIGADFAALREHRCGGARVSGPTMSHAAEGEYSHEVTFEAPYYSLVKLG